VINQVWQVNPRKWPRYSPVIARARSQSRTNEGLLTDVEEGAVSGTDQKEVRKRCSRLLG
jgi:hypothetical protein